MEEIKRGSMWWADIPHDESNPNAQHGSRPVVVVSNDIGNLHSPSLLVCPVTTKKDKYGFIHPHVACANGRISYVLCEQIKVMDKELLGNYIGHVRDVEQDYIDRALMTSLGLFSYYEDYDEMRKQVKELENKVADLEDARDNSPEIDEQALQIGQHIKRIVELLDNTPTENKPESQPVNSQIAKFTARYEKFLALNTEPKHLAHPNATKWDDIRIAQFLRDHETMTTKELCKKYNIKSPNTISRYYNRFKQNKSL